MPSPLGTLTALSCPLQYDKCQRQSAAHPAEASVSRSVQLHLPFKQKWEKSRGPVYKRAIDHFFLYSSSSSSFPFPANLGRLISPTVIFASG